MIFIIGPAEPIFIVVVIRIDNPAIRLVVEVVARARVEVFSSVPAAAVVEAARWAKIGRKLAAVLDRERGQRRLLNPPAERRDCNKDGARHDELPRFSGGDFGSARRIL